jgi:hypothetical protein
MIWVIALVLAHLLISVLRVAYPAAPEASP